MTQEKNTFNVEPYDDARFETLVKLVDNAAGNDADFKNMKNIDLVSIFN